ncbi:MAG: hypothetical protein IMW98_09300 [Firmicutes bacterium]|nr:hypothetical protein [Bacillota bacterium]
MKERVKSVVLAVLVAFSLYQSAALWSSGAPAPVPHATEPVVFPGSTAEPQGDPASPERIVWVDATGARSWTDPQDPAFAQAWRALKATVAAVGPQALDGGGAAGGATALPATPRLEAVWPDPLPWSVIYAAAAGHPWTRGDGPSTSRVTAALAGGKAYLAVGNLDQEVVVELPAAPAELTQAAAQLGAAGGEAVVPLSPPAPWSTAGPVWVPAQPPVLGELAVAPEPLPEGPELPRAFFAETDAVRRIDEKGGGVIFTDGRSTLRRDPAGALAYDEPAPGTGEITFSTAQAVAEAARFVGAHGGWPGPSLIWQVTARYPAGSLLADNPLPSAIVVQFVPVVAGTPVAGPGGPLGVLVESGGPAGYRRLARAILGPSAGSVRQIIAPAQALAALDAAWPEIYPGGHSERRIADMRVVYFSPNEIRGRQALRPAWSIRLADGDEWAVDAYDGRVLSTTMWKP